MGSEDEWAAVCWFYAAYHLVRASLQRDPRFDDPGQLAQMSARLCMDDRYAQRHKGRRGGANVELGINDIVRLAYRDVRSPYERLHQASIDVRYESGLRATLEEVRAEYVKVRDHFVTDAPD